MKHEAPSLITADGDAVVLQSVRAEGRLEGLLLSMSLRQTFRNDTRTNIEVTYTFPLAWGAVLLGLAATLGGKRMTGQVVARQEARKRYEDAVEQGDAPIMVEQAQGGVFSASLGSLRPGEEAVIELDYAQLLAFEQGRVRLVIPTTIAPRYGDAVTEGGLPPDQTAAPDLLAEYPFGLSLTLTGAWAQAHVSSPTHTIDPQQQKEGEQDVVTLGLQRQAWLDRDFVLLLEGIEGQSFAIAGPDALSGEGHTAVILSECPRLPAQRAEAPATPLCLKILVDCSGSMAGQSIDLAREALGQLTHNLCETDLVAFSRFGDSVHRTLRGRYCEAKHIEALREAIRETKANMGGTEMEAALEDTFNLPIPRQAKESGVDILIVTDGDVWGAQRVIDAARRSGQRVFALGVGSAPAASLLREMAEATGGACEFVTPDEDMAGAAHRLLGRIRHSLPVQFKLRIEEDPLWVNTPPLRIAAEETVHTFIRVPQPLRQAPALQLDGLAPQTATLTLRSDDLVARLVAARQRGETEDKAEAMALAERYQLVTEDTNLLLVFERAEEEKTDGMPALHQVRPMMAAGSHGTSRVGSGKSTLIRSATGVRPHIAAYDLSGETVLRSRILRDNYVPSVWRGRSAADSKIDTLAKGGMDELEIPAFLRRQSASYQRVGSGDRRTQIITTFNAAIARGLNLRQALRDVMALDLGFDLIAAIQDAVQTLGSMTTAWACYLLWLSDEPSVTARLSGEARQALEQRLATLSPAEIRRVQDTFRVENLRPA